MDFAVVQAPSVNEGYSTFCTGLDLTGHLLFIYGAGSKVMVFNGHFQLVQIIRCSTGAGYIRAVAFNPVDEMIVLGYGKQIELYEAYRAHPNGHGSHSDAEQEPSEADEEDDDGECHHHEWRRAVSFAVPFEVSSLAWSARGVLAVGGEAGIALFEPRQMQDSLTSLLHPVSTAWIPSRVQSLPAGSRIDRLAFSPGGCFLVAADSRDRSSGRLRVWSFDTSCYGESHVLAHLAHVLGPPYRAKLDQLRAAASANAGQFVVLDHGRGVAIAGFSWWPSRKIGAGALLLTWSEAGRFCVWLPQPVPEGFTFHLCHSFEARLAYWLPPADEDASVASIAVLDSGWQSFCLRMYNFDRWREWLIRVEADPADFAYGFELDSFGPGDLPWIADPHFLVVARPANQSVQVFERIDSDADGNVFWETFSWNVAAKPSFPLQMVSPYRAIGASVFHGSPALLDVCTLAESGACAILDCAKLGPFDGEIVALQWVPDGHAFVTTATTSCYAVVFDASGLREERSIRIFSLPGEQVVFVGAVSSLDWATFYEKGRRRLVAYQLDFAAGLVVGEAKVLATFDSDSGHPGFIQTLDLDPSPGEDGDSAPDSLILYSSSDNRQWYLHRHRKRELVYTHADPVLLARTSIYGDIALVSPVLGQEAVHAITVATPSRQGPVLVAELDRVLAIKWVVFDAKQQVRHLLICTVSGIVILVASFQVDDCAFSESWHVLDLCSFPAFLSPPLPPFYDHSADGLDYDHLQHSTANVASTASISCIAKSLVIWLSVDDMIAMFAPLLESPMWDAVGNALVPAPECETWHRFYSFVYAVMAGGTADMAGLLDDQGPSSDDHGHHASPANSARAQDDYSELFGDLSFGDESSTESDGSDHDDDAHPHQSDQSASSISSIGRAKGLMQRLAHGLDGPGLKYMALNFLDTEAPSLDLEGFPLLCAYLSDAQDLLVSESLMLVDNSLSWAQFKRLGFVAWLRSEAVLHRLVEQVARYEIANGENRIEQASPLYLLLGKPRALQALWKTNSSSSPQMSAFLGRDFTLSENRLAASKNGFAALGKQKHHLAIAFFLLAGAIADALQVAVERLRDWPLALLVARMGGDEAAALFYERHLDRVDLKCVRGLLGSLLMGKGDVMGAVRSCLPHRPDLLLAVSQLSPYHTDKAVDDEVVLQAARRMLILGALDPAVKCLEQFGSQGLAFDLLTARMVQKRWQHARLQSQAQAEYDVVQ